jgi:hypothetical protein
LDIFADALASLIWETIIPELKWSEFINGLTFQDVLKWIGDAVAQAVAWIVTNIVTPIADFLAFMLGSAALGGILAVITTVVAAFFVLGAAIGIIVGLAAILKGAFDGIVILVKAFMDPIISAVKSAWEGLQPLMTAVKQLFAALAPVFQTLGEIVGYGIKVMTPLFNLLMPALAIFGGALSIVAKGIQLIWKVFLEPVFWAITWAVTAVANAFIYVYNGLIGIINILTLGLAGLQKVELLKFPEPLKNKVPEAQTGHGEYRDIAKTGLAIVHEGEKIGRGLGGDTYYYNVTLPNVLNAQQFDEEMQRLTRFKNLRSSGERAGSYKVGAA